jgi:CRISPR-associated protein (TIGR02584 family)
MSYHLVAVTGMSPQVITETLYAMNRDGDAWPDRLTIITTAKGRDTVWKGLHTDGHLAALCRELGRPELPFTPEDIKVVPGADGSLVEDARSRDDHEAMANFITDRIRELTADDQVRLHASIAGGRKTMTFYLGYAMSLFGRHEDKLTHVLVSEPFENRRDFYYPTRESKLLALRDGETMQVDARDAEVILADIPFVRQRNQLPRVMRERLGSGFSYRRLMNLINLADKPDKIRLEFHKDAQKLVVKDTRTDKTGQSLVEAEVKFSNVLLWTFYLMLAEATLENDSSYTRPKSGDAGKRDADLLARMLLQLLNELMPTPIVFGPGISSAQMAKTLLDNDNALDWLNAHGCHERSLRPFAEKSKGLDDKLFSTYLNNITATLETELPANLKEILAPALCMHASADGGTKRGARSQGAGYGINLPEPQHQIQIL